LMNLHLDLHGVEVTLDSRFGLGLGLTDPRDRTPRFDDFTSKYMFGAFFQPVSYSDDYLRILSG
jgi:hypothetical protein